MALAPTRGEVLLLFRSLIRTARDFTDYNITVDPFRHNHHLSGPAEAAAAFADGNSQLAVAKRQDVVQSLYSPSVKNVSEGGAGDEPWTAAARAEEQKTKRNSPAKRSKKDVQIINKDEEMNNAGGNGQSSISTCSSGEDNLSNELNGGLDSLLASNGKLKSEKSPATDPQSIYKRRERINERLKILQNLVPNGTKVDISTMLEETVSYIKFLKLQIKLLSSDDMWMYVPIAYNGMDMDLYQKIVPVDQWPQQN